MIGQRRGGAGIVIVFLLLVAAVAGVAWWYLHGGGEQVASEKRETTPPGALVNAEDPIIAVYAKLEPELLNEAKRATPGQSSADDIREALAEIIRDRGSHHIASPDESVQTLAVRPSDADLIRQPALRAALRAWSSQTDARDAILLPLAAGESLDRTANKLEARQFKQWFAPIPERERPTVFMRKILCDRLADLRDAAKPDAALSGLAFDSRPLLSWAISLGHASGELSDALVAVRVSVVPFIGFRDCHAASLVAHYWPTAIAPSSGEAFNPVRDTLAETPADRWLRKQLAEESGKNPDGFVGPQIDAINAKYAAIKALLEDEGNRIQRAGADDWEKR